MKLWKKIVIFTLFSWGDKWGSACYYGTGKDFLSPEYLGLVWLGVIPFLLALYLWERWERDLRRRGPGHTGQIL